MKRKLTRIALWMTAVVMLGALAVLGLSEVGPEVVTVETFAPDGTPLRTRLWIVDAEGRPWLQAALPWAEPWLQRMQERPRVVVHRVTGVREFEAVLVREPQAIEKVQALMRAKYGVRDLVASFTGLWSSSVPIRLDPVPIAFGASSGEEDAARPEATAGPSANRWRALPLDTQASPRP
jgi:hypothetical protein